MNKIFEFLDFLILATQGGTKWDFIKPEPPDNEKAYYRVLNPESKDELITLSREKDNISLKLIGEEFVINISSTCFLSVEVENKLRALYDEVRLSSKVNLKDVQEEFDRVILMLG